MFEIDDCDYFSHFWAKLRQPQRVKLPNRFYRVAQVHFNQHNLFILQNFKVITWNSFWRHTGNFGNTTRQLTEIVSGLFPAF